MEIVRIMKLVILLLLNLMLLALPVASHADIIEIPNKCIALYQEHNAVAYTDQCEAFAATASTNLSNYQCTSSPEWIDAYCNLLGRYDDNPNDDITEYSNGTTGPVIDTTHAALGCEGVANGDYIPVVPQPIDAYIGLVSTRYTLYSTAVTTINLAESRQEIIETGDSSEFFSNIYGMLWSIVTPLGDLIGMNDVFEDFSQLADDLATGGNCN